MSRLLSIACVVLLCTQAFGQTTASATQTVTLEVRRVASIAVTGDPQPLVITSATAGDELLERAEDRSTSYSITSNASNMKVAVSLDEPMPEGTRLYVELAAASGVSNGRMDISDAATPIDAVTGLSVGSVTGQQIIYTLEADADREALTLQTRKVILTLTD